LESLLQGFPKWTFAKSAFAGAYPPRNSRCISGTGFELSNHAIARLKDTRTSNIGFETPNDIVKVFNKGERFDAGNGEIGLSYGGLEEIIDPISKRIITFRPAKNRSK